MDLNLLSIIITLISIVVTIVSTILAIRIDSNSTKQKINTSIEMHNTYISHNYSSPASSDMDLGIVLVAMITAGSLYSQYASIITIIITIIGLLSIIIISTVLAHRHYRNTTLLILICFSYIACFVSTYLFLHPIFLPSANSGFANLFSKIFPMLGGTLICFDFIAPLYIYVIRGNTPSVRDCILYLIAAIFSIVITSGYLLSFILLV